MACSYILPQLCPGSQAHYKLLSGRYRRCVWSVHVSTWCSVRRACSIHMSQPTHRYDLGQAHRSSSLRLCERFWLTRTWVKWFDSEMKNRRAKKSTQWTHEAYIQLVDETKGKVDTHATSIDSTRKKRTKKKLTKVILSSLYTIHITQPYSTPLEFHPHFGGQITWK